MTVHTQEEHAPRKFCRYCGKMIWVGREYTAHSEPVPFRRQTRHYYMHYPECPSIVREQTAMRAESLANEIARTESQRRYEAQQSYDEGAL